MEGEKWREKGEGKEVEGERWSERSGGRKVEGEVEGETERTPCITTHTIT